MNHCRAVRVPIMMIRAIRPFHTPERDSSPLFLTSQNSGQSSPTSVDTKATLLSTEHKKCARHKVIIQPYLNVNQVQEVSSVKVNCSQSCTPEPLRHNWGLIAGMPWLKLLPQHRSCWEALLLQQWMVLNLVSYYCWWNNWNNVDTNLWVPASWGPA